MIREVSLAIYAILVESVILDQLHENESDSFRSRVRPRQVGVVQRRIH